MCSGRGEEDDTAVRRTQLMSYLLIVIPNVVAMPEASVVLPSNGSRIVGQKYVTIIAIVPGHARSRCAQMPRKVRHTFSQENATATNRGRFTLTLLLSRVRPNAVSLAMRFRELREDLQSRYTRRMQHPILSYAATIPASCSRHPRF